MSPPRPSPKTPRPPQSRHVASESSARAASPSFSIWPPLFAFVAFLSYLVTPLLPNAVLSADAQNFQDRMSVILAGNLPYLDTLYEHLPLALPPMMLPRVLPGGEETFIYTAVFGLLMTACLVATGAVVHRTAAAAGLGGGWSRWAELALPLVPIVAFRIDPVPTLLAAVAFYLSFVTVARRASWAGVAAIAAKGWPVVLAPIEWWAGRRLRAVGLVGFTGVLGGLLLLTPGFQEGRDFSGVHLETIAGSLLAWVRSISGADSGLGTSAGAVYVEAGSAILVVGPLLAAALLVGTAPLWRRRVSIGAAAQLVAVVTLALLLASPLLSAQFLIWLAPWLIFYEKPRIKWLFVSQGLATTGLLAFWGPSHLLWQTVLVGRNAALLWLAWELVRYARSAKISDSAAAARA